MTKKEFLIEVQQELDHLRVNATTEEKDKLNFSSFKHYSRTNCIYGQMTGVCNSSRAKELFPKKYYDIDMHSFAPVYVSFSNQSLKKGDYLTALEKYLYMVSDKDDVDYKPTVQHWAIIEYIKGNIQNIKL